MLSKGSVKKPYTVLVAVIMVIILGVVSLMKMTTDLLPSISLPYVIVMTTYPGASPETVEMVVTKPVESSMATISNIKSISSSSNENYSMVIMEFEQSANMDSASLEIRESLDQIKSYWDDSIGNPIIMKLNPDMLPVMVAAVGIEGMDAAEISEYTTNYLIPELESIEGVASASASGLLQESIHVLIREDKIAALNEEIFGVIDSEMADAEQELRDGQKELNDGKAEIADGWEEIDKNLADLEDAKKELADGKAEIADKKSDLEDGKKELNKLKDESSKFIADQTALAIDGIAQADAALITLNMSAAELQLKIKEFESSTGQNRESLQKTSDLVIEIQNKINEVRGEDGEDSIINDITPLTQENVEINDSVTQLHLAITYLLNDGGAWMTEVGTSLTWETLKEKVLDSDFATGANQGLALYEALDKINNDIVETQKLKKIAEEGIKTLTQEELEAAAGFGSADAQMAYGEAQLEAAEAQIESGEKQLETGLDQIESAKDQLRDAEDQLKDAQKQIDDGFEQLEEARQDAYLSADMEGVLTVDTVKALLTAQNFSMPGGYITEDDVDYLVRVGEKPTTTEELIAMPLINLNMEGIDVITLGDVADVFMTDNSADIYTNVDGSAGVMVSMQKQTGYSTGDVSNKINDKFEEMMEENPELKLINLMDQGIYIDMVIDSIFSNIIVGFGLAIIILIVFLKDWKPTLIIAVSIPISLVSAIVCMYFSKVTLNVISLSGLALGIGMLVDNSIVVIENIYRLRNLGYSMKEAAIEGSKEVAGAIAASTLTTVCVFLPIVFTEGITRQLFVDMGLTIGYSLVASLVIALTVVPAMASKVLTTTKDPTQGGISEKLGYWYGKVLDKCLHMKALILIATLVLLVVSALLSISQGTAFMPAMDSNQLSMTVTLPKETPLADTAKVTDEIVERISTIEDIENIGAMLGSGTMSMGGGEEATNSTVIYVTTKEKKEKTNEELAKDIEAMMADLENVELDIQTASMDMTALSGSGISIQVRGRELDTLQEIATEVAGIVETVEGTAEVSDGMEEATGEIKVLVDRQKAMDYGLTVGQIFNQLYGRLAAPTTATTLTTSIKEFDVYVINEKDSSMTREDLKNIKLDATNQDGKKVRIALSEVAEFEIKESLKSINRSEQTRYITVSASIADGYNVGLVSADLEKVLEDYELPSGYSLHFGGENEMIMEAMGQLMLMLLLAAAFMYLIMVAQFQSLLSPFIIMFTLPLAFTGGFFALFIAGSELSVIAVIGFIMLAGIIVNNGIVLVDYINQLRERGVEKREAILEAGRTRLRPVLMTALTTIFGLFAMVFSNGMGADLSKPMALVTIGGLVYGTALTLVVIPCIYDIFHPEKKGKKRKKKGTKKESLQTVN